MLTRRTNAYVPLEERTAIANRAGADLFLSIHANASADAAARGVETYFLNFAPNAEAEAMAARENAGSTRDHAAAAGHRRRRSRSTTRSTSRATSRAIVQASLFAQAAEGRPQTRATSA